MRRTYTLYIDGTAADIADDALVLMNYKQTDATAPAAVFNSWSQSVALPRTSKNNVIFDHIFRADHVTAAGKFNALARTPFAIYADDGRVLESGYLKLTEISETQYSATLYGGLGGFLFSLMYNSDGSKKSLADLVYTSGGDEHEFDFKITRDAVRQAWRHLAGLASNPTPWDYINFAPAYNGLPAGDFNSQRAFCPTGCYGVTANDGEGHTSRNKHVLVDLVSAVDEWAANDLRSYQQRPVVRMKAVLDAIADAANNGGYTVNLDANFFNSLNPYYEKMWLTLPKLDGLQLPVESGTEALSWGDTRSLQAHSYTVDLTNGDKGSGSVYKIRATIKPTAKVGSNNIGAWSMAKAFHSGIDECARNVVFYQLVAYDADGLIIGGSKVAAVSSKMLDRGSFPETITTLKAMQLSTVSSGIYPAPFTPLYNPTGNLADIAGTMYIGDLAFPTPPLTGDIATFDGGEVVLDLEAVNVHRVVLRACPVGIRDDDATYTAMWSSATVNIMFDKSSDSTLNITGYGVNQASLTNEAEFLSSGNVHSGAQLTKALLLGGTHTPADYLLAMIKTFGLCMTYDAATREVNIMRRNDYYGNGKDIDLTDRVDLTSRRYIPFAVNARWYEWTAPAVGRYADYYQSIYNIGYGMARVNTGFEFDGNHTDVLKDVVFKGAAEVLARNKYFVRVVQDGKDVPSPFLDGGKYTLWNEAGEAKQLDVVCPDDTATVVYVNSDYPGYDYTLVPKPEFCDKDGKALDGDNVLLLFDGTNAAASLSRYTLTDDNGLMTLYNDGAPCWLLGQWTIAANKRYTINDGSVAAEKLYLPRFRRIMTGASSPMVASHSLDMAVPQEIDQPAITVNVGTAVFRRGWRNYILDQMNADTKVVTCKVDLRGFQVGADLLRNFYYFDGCVWVLNAIRNYIVGGDGLTECEFIKVNIKASYTIGQNY